MTHERLTAYLLQELSAEEAERFEDECFAQDEWPAHLNSAEQELIDAYLFNQLNEDRRLRFEKNYLTTGARKARLLTAGALLQVLTQTRIKKAPSTKIVDAPRQSALLLPAAAVILVVIAIWLLSPAFPYIARMRDSSTAIFLELSSGHAERVTLPIPYDVLKIYLILPAASRDTVSYRVQWQDANSILGDLTADRGRAGVLIVRIPAAKLKQGRYVLKVFEIHRDGTEKPVSGGYYFTAQEKNLDTMTIPAGETE